MRRGLSSGERHSCSEGTGFEDPADQPQRNERGPREYEHFLGLEINGLRGKEVLNIGTGAEGIFEIAVARAGARLFTMSPYLGAPGSEAMRSALRPRWYDRALRMIGRPSPRTSITLLAGRAEEKIPLDEGSVDQVYALYSVPLYVDESKRGDLFCEIDRVLRAGGVAVLYPIASTQKSAIEQAVLSSGLSAEFHEVPEGDDRVYRGDATYRLTVRKKL